MLEICLAKGAGLEAARACLAREWGDLLIVRGLCYRLADCECLITAGFEGIAAFNTREPPVAELVAINAFLRRYGIGTALIDTLRQMLKDDFAVIRATTTNDNIDALRFYQRRGFRITGLRAGAVDEARILKPAIPLEGAYGIPIHDEIDLELRL
jgi:GNAT superfamily N-acetyltransferase